MPYIETESIIKTKVIGVAGPVDQNNTITRQTILEMIKNNTKLVSLIFLRKRQVFIKLTDNTEIHIGQIKPQYDSLIESNMTEVKSWEITGGQEIRDSFLFVAGRLTFLNHGHKAKFGMNIHIGLL